MKTEGPWLKVGAVTTVLTLLCVCLGVLFTVTGLSTLNALAAAHGATLDTAWLWFLSPYLPVAILAAVASRSRRAAVVVCVGALAVALAAARMTAIILVVPAGARPGHGALDAEFGFELGLLPVVQWCAVFVTAVIVGLVGLKRQAAP